MSYIGNNPDVQISLPVGFQRGSAISQTGNDGQTFPIGFSGASDENYILIFIDGVYQEDASFSLVTNDIVFDEVVAAGKVVEWRVFDVTSLTGYIPEDATIEYSKLTAAAQAFIADTDNHTDGATNGVFTLTERSKLSGIEDNATADQSNSEIVTAVNTQGGVDADAIVDGTANKVFTAADNTKLDGIETAATADQTKADIDALGINATQLNGLSGGQLIDVQVYEGLHTFRTSSTANKSSSSFTWTKPAGAVRVEAILVGGGGGAGGAGWSTSWDASGIITAVSGAGGGGAYCHAFWIDASTLGATEPVEVGDNGPTGGLFSVPFNGEDGGDSTFATLSANGGTGGLTSARSSSGTDFDTPGLGGSASGGDINIAGTDGENHATSVSDGTTRLRLPTGGQCVIFDDQHNENVLPTVLDTSTSGTPRQAFGAGGNAAGGYFTTKVSFATGGVGRGGIVIIKTYG